MHFQILAFCEKLRKARGMPLRSRFDPARFELTSHTHQAAAVLGQTLTANFREPAPLIAILGYLGSAAGVDILVDRLSLASAGVSPEANASLVVRDQPLGAALDQLLEGLGLAYRVIDARTLQITTRKAVAAQLELEFYPVASLLTDGQTPEALIARVKGRLAGSTWNDAGGLAAIGYDQRSQCLIVLQSQPVQASIERLLAEKPK